MTENISFLSCIHCNRVFSHQEVFIAFLDEEGTVVIANHLDCGESSNKPERKGTGWVILKRDYDTYELLTPES